MKWGRSASEHYEIGDEVWPIFDRVGDWPCDIVAIDGDRLHVETEFPYGDTVRLILDRETLDEVGYWETPNEGFASSVIGMAAQHAASVKESFPIVLLAVQRRITQHLELTAEREGRWTPAA
jgi:hypothetical protein